MVFKNFIRSSVFTGFFLIVSCAIVHSEAKVRSVEAQIVEMGDDMSDSFKSDQIADQPEKLDPVFQTTTSDPLVKSDNESEYGVWSLFLKLGLALSVVVLLAWGIAHAVNKSGFGRQYRTDGSLIRVVERSYLGPKKAVYLVEIGGRALALGVTDNSVSPLSHWEKGEIDLPERESSSVFSQQLKSVLTSKQEKALRNE